jgi:hypothetical protein
MKWPWQAVDPKRGTLTLLDDCWVLGVPHGTTKADGQHIADLMQKAWPNLPKIMVYQFPLDVLDKRTKR